MCLVRVRHLVIYGFFWVYVKEFVAFGELGRLAPRWEIELERAISVRYKLRFLPTLEGAMYVVLLSEI